MNGDTLILLLTWLFIAGLLIIQPWFTRRNVLFGVVFGSTEIWQNEESRQIRRRYLVQMSGGVILLTAVEALFDLLSKYDTNGKVIAFFIGNAALFALGTAAFIAGHTATMRLKNSLADNGELVTNKVSVDLSMTDQRTVLPAGWLLLLLPVLLAGFLVALIGYPAMAEKLPVHYGFTAVDGWTAKSWLAVLTPLLIDLVLTLIILISSLFTRRAPASVRGNPDVAPGAYFFRKMILFFLIGIGAVMQLSFLLMEIGFLRPVPPLLFEIPGLLSLLATPVLFVVYFRFIRVKKPRGPVLEDDAKWVMGMFYYNPGDPSPFIEKRTGIGFTLNFARPAAWIILAAILGLVAFVTILPNIK